MPAPAITLRNVRKRFGEIVAVDGLDPRRAREAPALACSAPTAPASRRRCACSRRRRSPRRARSRCWATPARLAKSIDNFNYVNISVITPLFLVAGTFFPIEALPAWAATLAELNPLHHRVELVRDAVFGMEPAADLLHIAVLAAFALAM
jgi:hypothetical protein